MDRTDLLLPGGVGVGAGEVVSSHVFQRSWRRGDTAAGTMVVEKNRPSPTTSTFVNRGRAEINVRGGRGRGGGGIRE